MRLLFEGCETLAHSSMRPPWYTKYLTLVFQLSATNISRITSH